jgi:hypothetical protein
VRIFNLGNHQDAKKTKGTKIIIVFVLKRKDAKSTENAKVFIVVRFIGLSSLRSWRKGAETRTVFMVVGCGR